MLKINARPPTDLPRRWQTADWLVLVLLGLDELPRQWNLLCDGRNEPRRRAWTNGASATPGVIGLQHRHARLFCVERAVAVQQTPLVEAWPDRLAPIDGIDDSGTYDASDGSAATGIDRARCSAKAEDFDGPAVAAVDRRTTHPAAR